MNLYYSGIDSKTPVPISAKEHPQLSDLVMEKTESFDIAERNYPWDMSINRLKYEIQTRHYCKYPGPLGQDIYWSSSYTGAGLRLAECMKLRVKDFNFDHGRITVHDGKGKANNLWGIQLEQDGCWESVLGCRKRE